MADRVMLHDRPELVRRLHGVLCSTLLLHPDDYLQLQLAWYQATNTPFALRCSSAQQGATIIPQRKWTSQASHSLRRS